jgi:protein TonB
MFEQSIIAGAPKKRRAWTISLSITGQIVAVGVAVLIPLVAYDQLPVTKLTPRFLPQPPSGRSNRPRPDHVKVAAVKWEQKKNVFTEPNRIPPSARMIVDPAPSHADETGPGIIGGVGEGGGDRDGVIGGILKAASEAEPAAPPKVETTAPAAAKSQIQRIRLGGVVLEAKLIHRVIPVYPAPARIVRASGNVMLQAVIGRDGHIQEIKAISGHPLLVAAAIDAVRQWIYQPTTLNGEPVEVDTVITVTFTLAR